MGKTLEDTINMHSLCIATDAPYTFKWRDNSGKSTTDLTLNRWLKNVTVKTTIETIKTEHQTIEINTEGKDETIISNSKFKTKNANGAEWEESLKPYLKDYLSNMKDKKHHKVPKWILRWASVLVQIQQSSKQQEK